MTVKILTDSVADVPAEVAKKLNITVIPLQVVIKKKGYRDDGVEITVEEFYKQIRGMKANDSNFPTTSGPLLDDFIKAYKDSLKEADEIVAVVVSSKLSNTYQHALLARENKTISRKDKEKIKVIDSGWGAMAEGLLAISAAELALEGKNAKEIIASIEGNKSRIYFLAILDTSEYVKRGGRVKIVITQQILPRTNYKPIMTLKNGDGKSLGLVRSSKRIARFLQFLNNHPQAEAIGLEYSPDAEGEIEKMAAQIAKEIDSLYSSEIPCYQSIFTPVMGTQAGPGVIAISVRE